MEIDLEDFERDGILEGNSPQFSVMCLHSDADSELWYKDQVLGLGASTWDAPSRTMLSGSGPVHLSEWVDAAAEHLRSHGGGPANVIACGKASFGAMLLAAEYPSLLASLILGDPEVDVPKELFVETIGRIRTPSLIIAAAPHKDTDISAPQSIAGGIENGVFVIIDDCQVPAHHNKPSSFNEWTSSFIRIAEGLLTFGVTREENHV